jgi:hypothetical protein
MIEDLVPNYPYHLEGLCGSDGVDEHVTVDADVMLRIEYAVLILLERVSVNPCSIQVLLGCSLVQQCR